MKYTADCPSCANECDINGEMHARAGVVCPKCSTGFVPEKIHRITPSEDEKQLERIKEELRREFNIQEGLEKEAHTCFSIALGFLVGAFIAVFVAFANEGAPLGFAAGGGCLTFAIVFFFFSHLLSIRAALQKLYRKD